MRKLLIVLLLAFVCTLTACAEHYTVERIPMAEEYLQVLDYSEEDQGNFYSDGNLMYYIPDYYWEVELSNGDRIEEYENKPEIGDIYKKTIVDVKTFFNSNAEGAEPYLVNEKENVTYSLVED